MAKKKSDTDIQTAGASPDTIIESDAYTAPSLDDLRDAAQGIQDSVRAFTYDDGGEGSVGAPEARDLVLGDDDPRDAELSEVITAEDTMFSGLIFDVNRIHVTLPNGHESARDVVRHRGAVAVVALTDDGRICLVRQYRTALDRVTVEIPAGKLDPGEDPLDEDEFLNVDLVPLDELIDAVLDGRIEDSKTVCGALICDAVAHRLEP